MHKHLPLPLLGLAVLAAGCTMIPTYDRPSAPVPAAWPAGAVPAAAALTNAPAAATLGWPAFITDAKLRELVATALRNNRDLRLAALNVERARGLYGIQRDALWPALTAAGRGSEQRQPADLSNTGRAGTTSRYDVNLGVAAWEIDFFGRIQSLKARALEEYLATEEARRGAQVVLVSSVATAYLTLAADRENLQLAQTTLETQRAARDLIRRRLSLGLVPELDAHRAQAQVDAARGEVARFTQRVALDENALDLLVGTPAPRALLPADLGQVAPPPEVAAGLPSEVLLARPDVLQAERRLKAAQADIGAARAALFPNISLTAAFGTASKELSGLFQAGSGAWSFVPQATLPIFDARAWSALKVTKIQRELAVTQYEKAIQTAFREVADALAVKGSMDEQIAAQESLVNAVTETHRLANVRYERGLDDYLGVLDAQRSLYAARQGLVALRLARLVNRVQLYAVLGGGTGE